MSGNNGEPPDHFKCPLGRAAVPEGGVQQGIGDTPQQAIFAKLTGREIKQKSKGVYNLALLASIIWNS